MNNGLVTGTVFYPSGKRASNVYVKIMSVQGGLGKIPIQGDVHREGGFSWRVAEAITDSSGRFTIHFLWSGAEFASDLSDISINLAAYNNPQGNSTASNKMQVRGYLIKDIGSIFTSSSPLLSNTDLKEYAPAMPSLIKKFFPKGSWNTAALTTESWLILGAANMYLIGTERETGYELIPEFEMPDSSNKTMCNCKQCSKPELELLPELEAILGNYPGQYRHEYETGGGGTAVAASPSFVRDFSGPAAECTAALTRAGKTRAQALAIINAQIALAIRMLRVAANKLKQGSRSAQTNKIFQRIFRVPPSFVPTWLKQSTTIKDRGDVVAVRCSKVADLLASRRIRFFCSITSTNCPDCGNDNSPFACSSWGDESAAPRNSNVICFGSAFWDAMKRGATADILSTVMHEPFHIYFGKYVTEHAHPSGRSVGKFGGIDCIVRFVFEINGQAATALDIQACDGYIVRSAATGY